MSTPGLMCAGLRYRKSVELISGWLDALPVELERRQRGPYAGHEECVGIPPEIHVDLYIPGCPPHPLTILDGILRLIGRID